VALEAQLAELSKARGGSKRTAPDGADHWHWCEGRLNNAFFCSARHAYVGEEFRA
jgi:hypothetical protein